MTSPISEHSVRSALTDAVTLREAVFMALGMASMCWDPTPVGVFESGKAAAIGEALMTAIQNGRPDRMTDIVGGSADRLPEVRATERE